MRRAFRDLGRGGRDLKPLREIPLYRYSHPQTPRSKLGLRVLDLKVDFSNLLVPLRRLVGTMDLL
jgi:hypothetical protein